MNDLKEMMKEINALYDLDPKNYSGMLQKLFQNLKKIHF